MNAAKVIVAIVIAGTLGLYTAHGLSPDAAVVSPMINEFALALYRCVANTEGNFAICPRDAVVLLAMVYGGARGSAAMELSSAMYMGRDQEAVLRALGEWLVAHRKLREASGVVWNEGYKMWLPSGIDIVESYRPTFEKVWGPFDRLVGITDNAHQFERSYRDWLENTSQGGLTGSKTPLSIIQTNSLLLTSVAMFQNKWAMEFPKEHTRVERFNIEGGIAEQAPFMRRIGRYAYARNAHLEIVRVPCRGFRLSVWFLLPRENVGLKEVESLLTPDQFDVWREQAEERFLEISLPRVELDTELELIESLRAMGIAGIFSDSADFSGLSSTPGIKLGSVLCRAKVVFNEQGGSGSATSELAARFSSGRPGYSMPVFRASRPFLFLITDESLGTILFVGRVANPKLN